jgi:DNA polymerase gamma 1
MRSKVFGAKRNHRLDPRRVEIAKEHLAYHNLLGKKTTVASPISFPLPNLLGKDLDEHFHRIGRDMSEPYLSMALQFVADGIPDMPKPQQWIKQAGWTKYSTGEPPQSVDMPDADALVFDTEVLYNTSDFAVLAVAASKDAWYGWISPWLLGQSENPRHLIPLGTRATNKIIIGHNAGYDRKRVKDEYHFEPSKSFFLDTMSLHVAVNGMCSRQRPAWMKMNRKKTEKDTVSKKADSLTNDSENSFSEDLEDNPWYSHSALNNLADVASLHCGIKVDKSTRDYFGELDREGVISMFEELMTYCATDVDVTYKVYQKVLPAFLKVCPHPVSFGALRNLLSVFLPIDKKWEEFLANAERCHREVEDEIYNRLRQLANDAVELRNDHAKCHKDPWLSQLDWTIKPVRMVKGKKGAPDRPAKNQKLPGMPQWYRDLFPTATKPMNVSIRTRIAPILLRLQWNGHPLIWSDVNGWIFKVGNANKEQYSKLNYAEADLEQEQALKNDLDFTYFKVPHKDGPGARCTSPMAKGYMSYFDQGVLSSPFEYAKSAVALNSQCAYWIAARERIGSQMPVYAEDVDMGVPSGELGTGMILPRIIPMGTVTRRGVEDTWLTASNAKKTRIGSELKAMVRAPPGYSFVGADVDSEELWIASVMGDSLFGIHGGTALGWMTLEGTKNEGTDLHSKTAAILNISRNQAKIFNYGRIYGAGLKFATQLLRQFNTLLSPKEAEEAARKLYKATKGVKTKTNAFVAGRFWRGGTESVVFNKLEEMAELEVPRTPVLGAAITQALTSHNLGKANFLTSRVNWTIQSSGVDYLHLLIASMEFLIKNYGISARLALTVHDEIRYLVKDADKYRASLALQISNLWTRAMFCQQLGLDNVPQSVAFFSMVDIDHVLRKEVDLDCVTPSHPDPIPPGEAIDINKLLEVCSDLGRPKRGYSKSYKSFDYTPRVPVCEEAQREPHPAEFLVAQVTNNKAVLKRMENSVKLKELKKPTKSESVDEQPVPEKKDAIRDYSHKAFFVKKRQSDLMVDHMSEPILCSPVAKSEYQFY